MCTGEGIQSQRECRDIPLDWREEKKESGVTIATATPVNKWSLSFTRVKQGTTHLPLPLPRPAPPAPALPRVSFVAGGIKGVRTPQPSAKPTLSIPHSLATAATSAVSPHSFRYANTHRHYPSSPSLLAPFHAHFYDPLRT